MPSFSDIFCGCAYENEVTQEMLKGRMKELFGIDSEDLMLWMNLTIYSRRILTI